MNVTIPTQAFWAFAIIAGIVVYSIIGSVIAGIVFRKHTFYPYDENNNTIFFITYGWPFCLVWLILVLIACVLFFPANWIFNKIVGKK